MDIEKGDELGPEKILILRDSRVGLEAFVVVDNVACGPAIGGVRMAPDVTVQEVSRLARAMTLKNAAAGLPHGGAKSGIRADPSSPPERKQALVRTFARAIRGLTDYIPGPDMGTDETCMAWIKDEIGRAVGLPRVIGGIPLDEIGATGLGLAVAADVAAAEIGLALGQARMAIEGFGAVGQHAARFLAGRGVKLVAASDSRGAIQRPEGLDVDALIAHKRAGRPLAAFPAGQPMNGGSRRRPVRRLDPRGAAGHPDRRQRRSAPGEADHPGRQHPRDGGCGTTHGCPRDPEPARFRGQCRRRDLRGRGVPRRHAEPGPRHHRGEDPRQHAGDARGRPGGPPPAARGGHPDGAPPDRGSPEVPEVMSDSAAAAGWPRGPEPRTC
jgi:hypothetical protein